MTPTETKDPRQRRLWALDSELEALKASFEELLASFGDAVGEVAGRPDLDGSIERRLADVADRLRNLKPELENLDFDVEQTAALFSAIVDVDRAVHAEREEDFDRFEQMLLGIERVRQVIRDSIDESVGGGEADRRRHVEAIDKALPGIKQNQLAALLGVDARTVRRWGSEPGRPEQRLVLVTRLVSILSHAWTPAGVIAWFDRARRDLDGRAPGDLLDDPANERTLIAAARSSRNQYAS
jgi:predicted Rdx family selenoprotein